jgi:hypothetical protein
MTKVMETNKTFDFASFKEEALKDLVSGKPMMGEGGIFTLFFIKTLFRSDLTRRAGQTSGSGKSDRQRESAQRAVEERSSEQYGEIRVGNTSR